MSVRRQLDGHARLLGSLITSIALPIAPAGIQEGIRRYLDHRAGVVDFSVSSIALPITSVGVHQISVRRYFDCDA
jgi:hypothetical protein